MGPEVSSRSSVKQHPHSCCPGRGEWWEPSLGPMLKGSEEPIDTPAGDLWEAQDNSWFSSNRGPAVKDRRRQCQTVSEGGIKGPVPAHPNFGIEKD